MMTDTHEALKAYTNLSYLTCMIMCDYKHVTEEKEAHDVHDFNDCRQRGDTICAPILHTTAHALRLLPCNFCVLASCVVFVLQTTTPTSVQSDGMLPSMASAAAESVEHSRSLPDIEPVEHVNVGAVAMDVEVEESQHPLEQKWRDAVARMTENFGLDAEDTALCVHHIQELLLYYKKSGAAVVTLADIFFMARVNGHDALPGGSNWLMGDKFASSGKKGPIKRLLGADGPMMQHWVEWYALFELLPSGPDAADRRRATILAATERRAIRKRPLEEEGAHHHHFSIQQYLK